MLFKEGKNFCVVLLASVIIVSFAAGACGGGSAALENEEKAFNVMGEFSGTSRSTLTSDRIQEINGVTKLGRNRQTEDLLLTNASETNFENKSKKPKINSSKSSNSSNSSSKCYYCCYCCRLL